MSRDRFQTAPWLSHSPITTTIVGCGGFGSYLAHLVYQNLPKGSVLRLIDNDIVSAHNVGTQHFFMPHIGTPKVEAVAEILRNSQEDGEILLQEYKRWYQNDYSPYMFAAVDSMEVRKQIYEIWKSQDNRKLLIDSRSENEMFHIYVVTPGDRELWYEQTLYSDAEAVPPSCTFRQTPQTMMMAASLATQCMCNVLRGTEPSYLYKWFGQLNLLMTPPEPQIEVNVPEEDTPLVEESPL